MVVDCVWVHRSNALIAVGHRFPHLLALVTCSGFAIAIFAPVLYRE